MSDIIAAIARDIEEYEYHCKFFDEKVQETKDYYGYPIIDCYGNHAEELKERFKTLKKET